MLFDDAAAPSAAGVVAPSPTSSPSATSVTGSTLAVEVVAAWFATTCCGGDDVEVSGDSMEVGGRTRGGDEPVATMTR